MGEADSIKIERKRPCPLYKEGEYQASSSWPFGTCLKSRSHTNGHDWVTRIRIDENPVNKGDTISSLTRRAKETASQNTLRWRSENDSNKGLAVV